MHEFRYEYVKPKYDGKTKLCYNDKRTFFVSLKTDDIYKNTAKMWKGVLTLQSMI